MSAPTEEVDQALADEYGSGKDAGQRELIEALQNEKRFEDWQSAQTRGCLRTYRERVVDFLRAVADGDA